MPAYGCSIIMLALLDNACISLSSCTLHIYSLAISSAFSPFFFVHIFLLFLSHYWPSLTPSFSYSLLSLPTLPLLSYSSPFYLLLSNSSPLPHFSRCTHEPSDPHPATPTRRRSWRPRCADWFEISLVIDILLYWRRLLLAFFSTLSPSFYLLSLSLPKKFLSLLLSFTRITHLSSPSFTLSAYLHFFKSKSKSNSNSYSKSLSLQQSVSLSFCLRRIPSTSLQ